MTGGNTDHYTTTTDLKDWQTSESGREGTLSTRGPTDRSCEEDGSFICPQLSNALLLLQFSLLRVFEDFLSVLSLSKHLSMFENLSLSLQDDVHIETACENSAAGD